MYVCMYIYASIMLFLLQFIVFIYIHCIYLLFYYILFMYVCMYVYKYCNLCVSSYILLMQIIFTLIYTYTLSRLHVKTR